MKNCKIGRCKNAKGREIPKSRLLYALVEYSKAYGIYKKRSLYYKISTLKTIIRYHK